MRHFWFGIPSWHVCGQINVSEGLLKFEPVSMDSMDSMGIHLIDQVHTQQKLEQFEPMTSV